MLKDTSSKENEENKKQAYKICMGGLYSFLSIALCKYISLKKKKKKKNHGLHCNCHVL